jgi:hypothetical protein
VQKTKSNIVCDITFLVYTNLSMRRCKDESKSYHGLSGMQAEKL